MTQQNPLQRPKSRKDHSNCRRHKYAEIEKSDYIYLIYCDDFDNFNYLINLIFYFVWTKNHCKINT